MSGVNGPQRRSVTTHPYRLGQITGVVNAHIVAGVDRLVSARRPGPGGGFHVTAEPLEKRLFFRVELLEETVFRGAQVEGASGTLVFGGAGAAVVEAPTGRAAVAGAFKIRLEVFRVGLPVGVTPAEGLLVMHRHRTNPGCGIE